MDGLLLLRLFSCFLFRAPCAFFFLFSFAIANGVEQFALRHLLLSPSHHTCSRISVCYDPSLPCISGGVITLTTGAVSFTNVSNDQSDTYFLMMDGNTAVTSYDTNTGLNVAYVALFALVCNAERTSLLDVIFLMLMLLLLWCVWLV
jgi:hypothetical protein